MSVDPGPWPLDTSDERVIDEDVIDEIIVIALRLVTCGRIGPSDRSKTASRAARNQTRKLHQ